MGRISSCIAAVLGGNVIAILLVAIFQSDAGEEGCEVHA